MKYILFIDNGKAFVRSFSTVFHEEYKITPKITKAVKSINVENVKINLEVVIQYGSKSNQWLDKGESYLQYCLYGFIMDY